MTTAKGTIDIAFSGAYNLGATKIEGVDPMSAVATWVIAGGTGAYKNLRGDGSAHGLASEIDGATWPYIFHGVTGQISWAK